MPIMQTKLHVCVVVFAAILAVSVLQVTCHKASTTSHLEKRAATSKDTINLNSPNTEVKVDVTVPELTGFTACLWMKSNDTERSSTAMSYAVEGSNNEILLLDTRNLAIFVKGVRRQTNPQVNLNDGEWHHLCTSWSSEIGLIKVYKDGVLVMNNSSLESGEVIAGGGTLVLGQDQDSVGGDYQDDQAFIGDLTEFNMWSKALSDESVAEVYGNCSIRGDVFAWNPASLNTTGDVSFSAGGACGITAGGRRDPHMRTFSGLKYNFQGFCSYTLVKDCRTSTPSFDISAAFRGRSHPTKPPTRMVSVTTKVDGADTYTFLEDHSILVNGRPTGESTLSLGVDLGNVKADDDMVKLYLKKDGVTLTWIGKDHEADVSIDNDKVEGKLCGMFGDGTLEKGHDLLKRDGTKTFNTTEFAESWLIPGSCP